MFFSLAKPSVTCFPLFKKIGLTSVSLFITIEFSYTLMNNNFGKNEQLMEQNTTSDGTDRTKESQT